MDAKKIKKAITHIDATQETLKRELAKSEAKNQRAKPQAISPSTKLPVDHPESQAVERIHYEMQTSLCGLPVSEAEAESAFKKHEKKNDAA